MWPLITTGFGLGLLSSFHCIGMCGPLALALPVHYLPKARQLWAIVLYNLGRVTTYSLMGLVFGLAGRTIFLAGFQRGLTITLGVVMLLITARYFFTTSSIQLKAAGNFYSFVQRNFSRFLQPKRMTGFIVTGMLNGLLPCGMVYMAIAGAVSTSLVSNGAWFMFFFGLGTCPAMLALGLFGFRIGFTVRQQIKTAMPYIVGIMGLLFILRGMQLGIPFVSPVLPGAPGTIVACHK